MLEVPKGWLKMRDSSAVPSGLHSILSLFPKVETLGYYRISLREKDWRGSRTILWVKILLTLVIISLRYIFPISLRPH